MLAELQGLQPTPRVLVIDDDIKWQQAHAYNLQRWGYRVYVAEGFGEALIEDAVAKAQQHQCHVALVDMCLLDEYGYDNSGLDLVQKLMPTLSIMVSAYGTTTIAADAVVENGAAGFVGKQENPKRLQEALARVMARNHLTVYRPQIMWASHTEPLRNSGSFANDGQWSLQEVEEVITRLFPKARQLWLDWLNKGEVVIQHAPRLRALVLRVWEDDRQPVFVKVTQAQRIRAEVERYEAYIRGRLRGNHHARLVNHMVLWKLGAVCYELLDVQLVGVRPFSRFFAQESSPEVIGRVLEDFFAGTWVGHYGQPQMEEMGLGAAYGRVWEHNLRQRVGQFVVGERPLTLLSSSAPLPNPLCWVHERLAAEPTRLVRLAVTHGDLHGDNMMVDVNGRICVIDYERTGWGPIYQDFIELETDMVVRLTAVEPTKLIELYKLFLSLTAPASFTQPPPPLHKSTSVAIQKTWLVIRHLRQLAQRVTGVDNMEQYLWGLLLNAVFRATLLRRMITNGSHTHTAEYQRALLWGSVICQRLEELAHGA